MGGRGSSSGMSKTGGRSMTFSQQAERAISQSELIGTEKQIKYAQDILRGFAGHMDAYAKYFEERMNEEIERRRESIKKLTDPERKKKRMASMQSSIKVLELTKEYERKIMDKALKEKKAANIINNYKGAAFDYNHENLFKTKFFEQRLPGMPHYGQMHEEYMGKIDRIRHPGRYK